MEGESEVDVVNKEVEEWMDVSLKTESLAPHILDEIALEGLDGITVQALRIRLKERKWLPIEVTDKSMKFIWKVILKLKGIEFFELPEPRGNLIVYRRKDYVDERGNMYEPLSAPEDLYLYSPVDKLGVRGSCPHFYTRKLMPNLEGTSLEYVEKTYGNKLVLVASQKLREQALLGPGSEGTGHMTIVQYCMLERIGRARFEGESTRGNVSLQTMKMDPKSLFYQRKYLIRKKMIKKQVFSMKFGKNRATSLISILHLPRFYTPFDPVVLVIARKMIAHLKKKPHMREESAEIKRKFGKTIYRSLLSKDFEQVFKEVDVPLAELHPEVFMKEKKADKKESMLKRTQKSIQFLNPPGDIESYLPNLKEQECRAGDTKGECNTFIKGIIYSPTAHLFDTPLHRSQELICRGGSTGVILSDIASHCEMYTLAARTAGRFCVRCKYAKSAFVEKKKTKANKYVFTGAFPVPPPITSFPDTEKLPILGTRTKKAPNARKSVRAQLKSEAGPSLDQLIESLVAPYGDKHCPTASGFGGNDGVASAADDRHPAALPDVEEESSSQFQLVCVDSIEPEEGPTPKKKRKTDAGAVGGKISAAVRGEGVGNNLQLQKDRFARLFLGKEKPEAPKKKKKKLGFKIGQNSSFKKSKDGLYYDEKDLEALAKKNKQRVTWTVDEDQIILLLFIASVVFIRKYNLKKLFIFNAAQIRDMLHMKSEESRHKTSLAIRRRMHFLIRNPTFRSKYTYYLHDAVRDEFILHNFVSEFESTVDEDSQKIFHSIPTELILKVYDYLVQKHGSELAQPRISWEMDQESEDSRDENLLPPEIEVDVPGSVNGTVIDEAEDAIEKHSTESSGLPIEEEDELEEPTETDAGELSVEEVECWIYDGSKKVMVDATRDPTTPEELETWICRTVVFSLMFSGDCVSDVEPFLERFGDDNLDFIASNCRKLNICSINRRSHKFGLSSIMRRRLANHLHPAKYRGANEFLKAATHDFQPAHTAVATNNASLFSLIEFLPDSKMEVDISVGSGCAKESEVEQTPFTINPMRRKKSKLASDDEENVAVNLPSVKVKIPCEVDTLVYGDVKPSLEENKEYLTELLFRVVPVDTFKDDYVDCCTRGEPLPLKYSKLYLKILQAEEVGISMRLLRTEFSGPSLKSGLVFFLSRGYIYSVGVTQRKFVATKYVKRWAMKVPTQAEGRAEFHWVIIHPWITSTGRINWELVDRIMTAVLGATCLHPGVRVLQIMRYLSPVISGFEVALLLQALIHFGFVELYKAVRSTEPDLFSSRSDFMIDYSVDPFLELEDLFVEPKPFATVRYSRLQEMFVYEKDENAIETQALTAPDRERPVPEEPDPECSNAVTPEAGVSDCETSQNINTRKKSGMKQAT